MEVIGYFVSGYETSFGTVATIYVDAISDISSMTSIIGMNITSLGRGSVAYDKTGAIAIFDGWSWNAAE